MRRNGLDGTLKVGLSWRMSDAESGLASSLSTVSQI
jgi:hypothetical protein